ncbi:uncharacterized protein LOC114283340 [Camellia sinensis]|uniref:uncharacterized protein LOC114283340 n=1 Tax=Camellia sinensis TaxID=4442 RepID=UPI00103572F8|nr:uncharacterized protein LOC114283340 [Camellia sinensis]
MIWTQFKEIFYDKYFPQCFRDQKVSEFQELKQGNMSIIEYKAKFTKLARFAPHMVDTDYKMARKIEGGLTLEVFDWVGILKLPTYVEVLDRALMMEATLAAMRQSKAPMTIEWSGKRSGNKFRKGNSFGSKKQNTGSYSSSSQSNGSIPVCPDYGRKHKGICYQETGAYFKYGKTSHIMRDCPIRSENTNRPAASSAESSSVTMSNARANVRGNTGNETL